MIYYLSKKPVLSEFHNSLKTLINEKEIRPFVYCKGHNFYYIGKNIIITTKHKNIDYENVVNFPINTEEPEIKSVKDNEIRILENLVMKNSKTSVIINKIKLNNFIKENYNSMAKRRKIICNLSSSSKDCKINFKFFPKKKSSSVFESQYEVDKFPIVRKTQIENNDIEVKCILVYEALEIFEDINVRLEIDDNNEFIRFSAFRNGIYTKVIILTEN